MPVLVEEGVDSAEKQSSNLTFVPKALQPISAAEKSKIESFYGSFGTSLYKAGTCACFYTISNLKFNLPADTSYRMVKSSNSNRASIAIAPSSSQKQTEIDHEVLRDFMNNKYQNHVNVYHRGVPLWLFNSGNNPRRPSRQIKFTLAEKGTGFILWQDRIDACSDFKIYAQRKTDQKIINYCERIDMSLLSSPGDNIYEQFSSMLIAFRASDKKTTVFVKFDMNNEAAKFHEYFIQLSRQLSQEIKQRTKSLPAGVQMNITNRAFNASAKNVNVDSSNVVRRVKNNMPSPTGMQKLKRQSYFGSIVRPQRRISKNDISNPCDMKHVININTSDRNSFYTLSKLLPISICSSLSSSSCSPNESISLASSTCSSNKSTPSPTNSSASSSSLSNRSDELAHRPSSSSSSNALSSSPPFNSKNLPTFELNQHLRNFQKSAN